MMATKDYQGRNMQHAMLLLQFVVFSRAGKCTFGCIGVLLVVSRYCIGIKLQISWNFIFSEKFFFYHLSHLRIL